MAELSAEDKGPNDQLNKYNRCNCKSEPKQSSAKNSPLNPHCVNKRTYNKNSVQLKAAIFKGREQRFNRAIIRVLSKESPLAVWNIYQHITSNLKGFNHSKYAIINARVKALQAQGYLRITGVRTKQQGGSTNLYELTARAKLAVAISTKNLDDLINELDEDSAKTILQAILKQIP